MIYAVEDGEDHRDDRRTDHARADGVLLAGERAGAARASSSGRSSSPGRASSRLDESFAAPGAGRAAEAGAHARGDRAGAHPCRSSKAWAGGSAASDGACGILGLKRDHARSAHEEARHLASQLIPARWHSANRLACVLRPPVDAVVRLTRSNAFVVSPFADASRSHPRHGTCVAVVPFVMSQRTEDPMLRIRHDVMAARGSHPVPPGPHRRGVGRALLERECERLIRARLPRRASISPRSCSSVVPASRCSAAWARAESGSSAARRSSSPCSSTKESSPRETRLNSNGAVP